MSKRPETTLFMLVSVDGKISTGDNDHLDFDRDLPQITGAKEGLQQYYDIEQQTDLFSLNSGKVLKKIGANEKVHVGDRSVVSFLIIDNRPHLNLKGVDYFLAKAKRLFIITTNADHPAFSRTNADNLEILKQDGKINFTDVFSTLKGRYGIDKMTIQTGGELNAVFLREKLVDHLSLVVAPIIVGGKNTPTLVDGESLHAVEDLKNLTALKLKSCAPLNGSYLHIKYDVVS